MDDGETCKRWRIRPARSSGPTRGHGLSWYYYHESTAVSVFLSFSFLFFLLHRKFTVSPGISRRRGWLVLIPWPVVIAVAATVIIVVVVPADPFRCSSRRRDDISLLSSLAFETFRIRGPLFLVHVPPSPTAYRRLSAKPHVRFSFGSVFSISPSGFRNLPE